MRLKKLCRAAGMIAFLTIGGAAVGQDAGAPTANPPAAAPAAPAAPVPASAPASNRAAPASAPTAGADAAALDPVADRILTRLEERQIRDVKAHVVHSREAVLSFDDKPEEQRGTIWYLDGKPCPKFLVEFDKQISGGKIRPNNVKHLFDGVWYVHLDGREGVNTVSRTQVRRPNAPGNPFKISDGRFPLPWGQKKADILAEYSVAAAANQLGDPPDTDRLRLTPRPGAKSAGKFRWVDFWIARSGEIAGLPIQVRVAEIDGTGKHNSTLTVTFSEVKLNSGISDSIFKLDTPRGWHEEPPVELKDDPPAKQ